MNIKEQYEEEITKILAKTMQSSYRRNELVETLNRIVTKFDIICNKLETNDDYENLRKEFFEVKRKFGFL